jgi:hypothetical protein
MVRQPHREYILFDGQLRDVVNMAIAFEARSPDPGDPSVAVLRASVNADSTRDGLEPDRSAEPPSWHEQSPDQWWPDDHSWCVATEIDFDCTLVGGTRELIDTVLNDPRLEVFAIPPEDDLTYEGDHINPRLTRG